MSPSDSTPYSYDVVPYPSKPFAQTHPDRLATIGMLFGMQPKPVEKCRVLEIGCARGNNLVPMAEQLPGSQFVGIDLSRIQVDEARQLAERLGLVNIQFHHLNILDFDATFGEFDYIICHGVFSWVPGNVQDKILEICSAHLAPQGVAYISYNTYPGWHMRYMIRDMMCYHTSRFPAPQTRIQEARNLLEFLANNASEETAFGKLLKTESQSLRNHEDGYLFHEHLEEINQPCYFFQFAQRAEAKGLQYLGEADMASMWAGHLAPNVAATLNRVASDLIQMEQFMDFVRNRTFRQTLLCRAGVKVDRELRPDQLARFHVASALAPTDRKINIRSSEPLTLKDRFSERSLTSSVPFMKAAMVSLAEVWPASIAFPDLVLKAQSRATKEPLASSQEMADAAFQFGKALLEGYLSGLVELHSMSPRFCINVGDRPLASTLARVQAESGNTVTNLRHESKILNEVARQTLIHLDGTRDQGALIELLLRLIEEKVLLLPPDAVQGQSAEVVKEHIDSAVCHMVTYLARSALLIR